MLANDLDSGFPGQLECKARFPSAVAAFSHLSMLAWNKFN
jgi:hypothetical protein